MYLFSGVVLHVVAYIYVCTHGLLHSVLHKTIACFWLSTNYKSPIKTAIYTPHTAWPNIVGRELNCACFAMQQQRNYIHSKHSPPHTALCCFPGYAINSTPDYMEMRKSVAVTARLPKPNALITVASLVALPFSHTTHHIVLHKVQFTAPRCHIVRAYTRTYSCRIRFRCADLLIALCAVFRLLL